MSITRMLEGLLTQTGDFQDDCFGTPAQFVKSLLSKLGVQFPVKPGEDFVVYGFQTPGEDEKGKLWWASDRASHFTGAFMFINGKWQRVYNHSIQDVVWKYGDSRVIEDGFQLIDGTVASIDVDTQTHIMGFYRIDPVDSTALHPVYTYFATVYVGI